MFHYKKKKISIKKINVFNYLNIEQQICDRLSKPHLKFDSSINSKELSLYIKECKKCNCEKKKGCYPLKPKPGCAQREMLYSTQDDQDNCVFKPKITRVYS